MRGLPVWPLQQREAVMAIEREIQETIARCVGIMVFYVNSQKTRPAKALMIAEVQAVAGLVKKWGLSGQAMDDSVFRPVEAELLARYGREEARKLNTEFVEAFGKTTEPAPILFPSRV
jgi:hypothetical protein